MQARLTLLHLDLGGKRQALVGLEATRCELGGAGVLLVSSLEFLSHLYSPTLCVRRVAYIISLIK